MTDKDEKLNPFILWCYCPDRTHRLVIDSIHDTGLFSISVENGDIPLVDRIKMAFNILIGKHESIAEVICDSTNAQQLSNWLFYRSSRNLNPINVKETEKDAEHNPSQ